MAGSVMSALHMRATRFPGLREYDNGTPHYSSGYVVGQLWCLTIARLNLSNKPWGYPNRPQVLLS